MRKASLLPLAPLAAIVAAQAYLLSRELDFRAVSDEANYVLSMQAMRHGEALGRQIFISQPPGFFVWLRWLSVVFGDSLRDSRVEMIFTVSIAAVALYVLGNTLVGPIGGLAAAAMLTITTPIGVEGSEVYADTPAYALGAAAVALAASRRPALAGILLTASISCKLSGVIAILPVLALLYTRSARPWPAVLRCVVGALTAAVILALVFIRDLSQIWNGVVRYHVDSYALSGFDASDKLSNWASPHAPYFYLAVLGLLATAFRARRLWPLWLWPLSAVAFLFTLHPLHDNHMLVMPYSVAGAAGPALGSLVEGLRPRLVAVFAAAGALAMGAGWVQQLHLADQQTTGEVPSIVAGAAKLDQVTKPGDLVISDQGIVALIAHRRVPGAVADSSVMRFAAGNLTPQEVQHLIVTMPVQAVFMGRAFQIPELKPIFLVLFGRDFEHVDHPHGGWWVYSGRRPALGSNA